ncbi:hypothetical protein J132_06949 [Termitomyces sp. J132]|nr:hypothetical protein C0989_007205 [Termitomyces sp. Mn162]KAH0587364.1 hypothetical protein H2248_006164 [Termitomyces sp. 'cryptogamus']KNZ74437.1 hypothetical protein J132_06949 [Termitomyces sp. J132]
MDPERIEKSFTITFEEDALKEIECHPEYRPRAIFRSRSPHAGDASHTEASAIVQSDPSYLVTEAEIAKSYLSATLSTIQPLGDNKSLLIMTIACHPAPGRRFTNATVTWNISPPSSSLNEKTTERAYSPKIVTLAPQHSIGGWTEEQSRLLWSLSAPVEFCAGGVKAGIEPSFGKDTRKMVLHAMSIIGTIRGIGGVPHATWTIEENKSSERGIPSHFQLAIVVDHAGPFISELDVDAHLGGGLWSSFLQTKKGRHGNDLRRTIDVEIWKCGDILWEPGESGWKKFVAGITGEVDGLVQDFAQAIVRP